MKIETSCPLGHTCEKVVGDHIERCVGYIEIAGAHPQTGEETREWNCSLFHWLPILTLEAAKSNRGQTQAIESFRNDLTKTVLQLANRKALSGG